MNVGVPPTSTPLLKRIVLFLVIGLESFHLIEWELSIIFLTNISSVQPFHFFEKKNEFDNCWTYAVE